VTREDSNRAPTWKPSPGCGWAWQNRYLWTSGASSRLPGSA